MVPHFLTVPPKTNLYPDPLMDNIDDPEMLRSMAFQIEDMMGPRDEATFSRAFFILIRSALLDFADMIERG